MTATKGSSSAEANSTPGGWHHFSEEEISCAAIASCITARACPSCHRGLVALAHISGPGRELPILCDDRLATDAIRSSGRQQPVQHSHVDGSLGLLAGMALQTSWDPPLSRPVKALSIQPSGRRIRAIPGTRPMLPPVDPSEPDRQHRQNEQRQRRRTAQTAKNDNGHWSLDLLPGQIAAQCNRQQAQSGHQGGYEDWRQSVHRPRSCGLRRPRQPLDLNQRAIVR